MWTKDKIMTTGVESGKNVGSTGVTWVLEKGNNNLVCGGRLCHSDRENIQGVPFFFTV